MTKEKAKDASLSIEKCVIANNPTPLTSPVRHRLGDSYNGMADLQPGMSQLQGQSQSQATQQTTASQSQPTSAQNGSSGATSK